MVTFVAGISERDKGDRIMATFFRKLAWRLLSAAMSSAGRASDGIDLGYRHGFDTGVMLDYVYENRPSGRYGIGALIDRAYLDAIGWRAIRARRALLVQILRGEIERAAALGAAPVVLADVAVGAGRYLHDLALAYRDTEIELDIVCRDLDPSSLELGAARARELGLHTLRYELGDATDLESLATIEPAPHVAVASGLYELFTDASPIARSMRGIARALRPGGRLVFTTQVAHPQLELIANVLVNREGKPWVMVCRSVEEVEAMARDAGHQPVSSHLEPFGLFAVTVCEKVAQDARPRPTHSAVAMMG